jgi:cysteine desulfurase
MGVPETLSHASLRFGLGRFNTEEDIEVAIEEVVATVQRLRDGGGKGGGG